MKGMCSCESDGILFEFQTVEFQADIGGIGIKSDLKEVRLNFDDLAGCRFKRGWFGGKAIFEGTSIKSVAKLPSADGNLVRFAVSRKDRNQADMVLSEINLRCSERSL